ncbi:hypothetical protein NIIg97_gp64 [Geobacillus phage vB_GthS_NIIg9.7]|nr:hypothetical protein NIIg97_gp64 [Geobacillus phage vB_GthS_NIIg9.7]
MEYNGKKREVVTTNGFVSFPVELVKKGFGLSGNRGG